MALINCPECGKEISDKVKACPHCGYPISEITTNMEHTEKKSQKGGVSKNYKKFLLGIIFLVITIVIALTLIYTNPVRRYKQEISAANFESANSIYVNKINGNEKQEKKIIEFLETQLDKILNDVQGSKLEYADALELIESIDESSLIQTKVKYVRNLIDDLNNSRIAYLAGIDFEESQEYINSIKEFNKVITSDENYESAQSKLSELSVKYKTILMDNILELEETKSYREIVSLLDEALTIFRDDNDLIGKKKKYEEKTSRLVVTLNNSDIYMEELMYYIYAVEATGASYDQAYQQYYGTSYWDMEYSEGVTMRDQTKQYVMDTIIMYEILYDKAIAAGYTISDEEIITNQSSIDEILTSISEEQLKITGFTEEILLKTLEKIVVGEKYYNKLVDGFDINDQAITDGIKLEDYESTLDYNDAVTAAIAVAEAEAFDAEYEILKKDYTVTINKRIWDPIVMGETTLVTAD